MSDVIRGQVDQGVKMLLDFGGEVSQRDLIVGMNRWPLVPFVIVFTKFDLIAPNVSSSHNDYEARCRSLFGNAPTGIVSSICSFVCVGYTGCLIPLFPARPRFRHLINKLVAITDGAIIAAHSRKISAPSEAQKTQPRLSPVSLAWSVSQRASRDVNVKTTIECITSLLLLNLFFSSQYCTTELDEVVSRVFVLDKDQFNKLLTHIGYWRRLWSSDDFVGQSLANCVEIVHTDIVGTWNLPDKDRVCLLFSSGVVVLIDISTFQPQSSRVKFLILFRV